VAKYTLDSMTSAK